MSLGPTLQSLLTQVGLGALVPWLSDMIVKNAPESEIELELYKQPAFKARFPAIFARQAANLPPISINDYLDYENTMFGAAHRIGMPLTHDEINAMIANNVSAAEADDRMQMSAQAVMSDPNTKQALQSIYGMTTGQIQKFWMNPQEEVPKLQQMLRAGQIGGAALTSGFGPLNQSQAELLASQGLDQSSASSGFAKLAQMSSLFEPLNAGETSFTTDQQLAVLAGDQGITTAVERQQQGRQAEFQGGGSFGQTQEGFATGTAK